MDQPKAGECKVDILPGFDGRGLLRKANEKKCVGAWLSRKKTLHCTAYVKNNLIR
jgi:hypothetical protein